MSSVFSKAVKTLNQTTTQRGHQMSKLMPEYTVERITPKLAEKYLAMANGHNRDLRPQQVKKYTVDMVDDLWKFNPADAIVFDTEGHLINGQHRLAAVSASGTTQYFLVCRNAPGDTFLVMDNNAVRRVADTTPYTQHQVTVARAMMKGARSSFLAPQNVRLADFIARHEEAITWSNTMSNVRGFRPPASVRGALARAYGNVDIAILNRFKDILIRGRDEDGRLEPEDSAAAALRDILLGVRRSSPGSYSSTTEYLMPRKVYLITELAVIKFAVGADVKRLRLPTSFGEQFYLPEDADPSLTAR